jgi:hypothetical protein
MAEIFDFFAVSRMLEKQWHPPQADYQFFGTVPYIPCFPDTKHKPFLSSASLPAGVLTKAGTLAFFRFQTAISVN